MNYQKGINKAAVAKRIIASWIVVAIVFFALGGVTGYVLKSCTITKSEFDVKSQAECIGE